MKIVAVFPETPPNEKNSPLLSAEKALNLPSFFSGTGHEIVVLTDPGELDSRLEDMSVFICSPFYPAYLTRDRIERAGQLNLVITAGVGSDHIDLEAARKHHISVVEVTGCNVVSVAEHTVMSILILLRDFLEGHRQVVQGEWNLPKIGARAHDLEGKTVGIVGFGRIGQLVAERLSPFQVRIVHYDPLHPVSLHGSEPVSLEELIKTSDIVTIHTPLTKYTDGSFNRELLSYMKKGAYLINTARGKIVETDALLEALETGHLAGYAGDVWYPQPAPGDHPWRTMPNHAMTIHYSGMTLEAQQRIADGVKDILIRFIHNIPMKPENVIVENGIIKNTSYRVK
ncbi:NAD-dependent formate dehydrogenase [Thermoactinomyces mirandus]|uniref:NAD-dependent formate dehydrogenase n=1 Tax=Thermoactinomyces mirandus TaxID=2756294 RepID=A0A7W1XUY8_9BACL|nr:NAD-dependent formate dehydrogenase [Thermoactinomyces mirandus]MBA4603768.1 NAD-dependent formate dehydrogenase [Thermoactinomyces mirandus]